MIDAPMQSRLAAFLAAAWLVVLFCVGTAEAQPDPADDASPMRALINPSELQVFIIDKDGKPQLLLGHRLKNIGEILEGKQGDQLAKIDVNGTIDLQGTADEKGGYCRVDATYSIRLTEPSDSEEMRWVKVPLHLDHAIVDAKSFRHVEPGEFFLHKDKAGYVAWLHAKPNSAHTIKLRAKVPFAEAGGVRTLDVKLPNMPTGASITVPRTGIVLERQDGSLLSTEEADGKTQIQLENNGGGISVGWVDRRLSQPLIEVIGTISVEVYANDVTAEAKLAVRSPGEPIDSFVVYLPPRMELMTSNVLGFEFEHVMDEQRGQQAVTVRRTAGPTSNVMEVQLSAAAPQMSRARASRSLQVAGFEVQGADRQKGTIDVTVRGNWSVTWTPDDFVQPEPHPSDADDAALAARFLYDRQPFSLKLDLRQQQPRVSVTASYMVGVSEERADLEARLRYETTGPQTENIEVHIAGWQVDEVELAGVATEEYSVDENDVLSVPLTSTANTLALTIRGHQQLPAEDGEFTLLAPRPIGLAQPAAAHLLVIPAENIELLPLLAESKWLVEDDIPEGIELPARATPPLCYREELSAETAESSQFAARKRLLSRTVDVTISSEAQMQTDRLLLRQQLSLVIAYGALREIFVEVPDEIIQSKTLSFAMDGEEAAYAVVDDVEDSRAGSTRVQVDLLQDRTGELVLTSKCEVPVKHAANSETIRILLPQPAEDEAITVKGNVLEVIADDAFELALENEGWTQETDIVEQDAPQHRMRLRTNATAYEALVRASLVEKSTKRNLLVSRAWLQTVLTNADRQDRAVFRLLSDDAELRVQLPEQADTQRLKVAINGQEAKYRVDDAGSLQVTQPIELVGREIALEMWYWIDAESLTLPVALPEVEDAKRIDRIYWEVALPRDQHLAWSPSRLTPELVWRFDNLYWGPRGRLEEWQLEELLGASSHGVATNMNRYLFSSTGSVASTTFRPVRRVTLMFLFSSIVLVAVLSFFYIEPLQHPVVYFVIGVVLIALAVTFPEPAVLAGQAGAIGVGLALVACLLHRVVGVQAVSPVAHPGAVLLPHDSQASGPMPPYSDGSSRATTATAPAHLQAPADPES